MPGSRVNLGMGQPGRKPAKAKAGKKAKGTAVKKSKGGAMMEPPGMKNGGDPTTPVGKYQDGGAPKLQKGKKQGTRITPDESGGRKKLKPAPNKGARMLPKKVRNKMGFMSEGGAIKKAKGGSVKPPKPKPRP